MNKIIKNLNIEELKQARSELTTRSEELEQEADILGQEVSTIYLHLQEYADRLEAKEYDSIERQAEEMDDKWINVHREINKINKTINDLGGLIDALDDAKYFINELNREL